MKSTRLFLVAGVAFATLIGSIGAFAASKTVQSGVVSRLTTHMRYDSSCTPIRVVIKILTPPANGTLTTQPTDITVPPKNGVGEPQPAQCIGKTVAGLAVFYQSNPGFHGQDSFKYRRFSPSLPNDRFNTDISFTVTVQ
jgi:hypothetical protein